MSSNLASLLLIKKLQCFFEIPASPKEVFSGTDFLINSQALLFAQVDFEGAPPVLIFDGCAISFFR